MTDRETIAAYDKNVEAYVEMTERDKPGAVLLAFMRRVRPGGLVLDLGCGPAASSAMMRDHGLRVDPVDASPEMVRLANNTYDIGARIGGFHDLTDPARYDGIWANFSLLHARPDDFPVHLRAIHRALLPGGIFHIGMKLGEGTRRGPTRPILRLLFAGRSHRASGRCRLSGGRFCTRRGNGAGRGRGALDHAVGGRLSNL